ncbi:MAG TPA: lipid A export permease/ATP-binding protein MsbA [Candidatus Accumulibacter phosphatis]|nr:MAG: Lipid A export ATP-binding/permease protein MsbA [Candidatus Accumulibacter sp. SK-11]HRL77041.1 lipid A export permease/ATP-binding protein MsbA [Candidatus Accumulibacter phosphatis]HRQ95062.1 lipid A export permease/ATP-binding protein MsbA [Candidatus Accumulibacter phosphatis]
MLPADSGTTPSLRTHLRLLGHLRSRLGLLCISLFGYLIFASSQPMMAAILKYFIDALASSEATRYMVPWLGALDLMYAVPLLVVAVITWQGIGSFLGSYFIARASLGLIDDLRRALFDNLLRLPDCYFAHHNSGHLISRITYDVTMVTGAATDAARVVVREVLTIAFLFGYLLWLNWKLTLVLVAILPLIGGIVVSANRKYRQQSRKIQVAMGDLTHIASEMVHGQRVVRSFGGEAYESARFQAASADNTAKQLRMVRTTVSYSQIVQLITFSAMAVLLMLILLLRGDASAGDLVAYLTAAGMLPKPVRQLSEMSATVQRGLAGAESIFAQLDEAPELDRGTVERDRVRGYLEVRNLSFSYPGSSQRVLDDISFAVAPGQLVAVVGRSGSGKSSLAGLIPRFYSPDEGQILIDGIDVEKYTLRNLRQHIALVTQQVVLFNDTVASNIAYGDLMAAPREAIRQAAAAAHACEFIDQLPQGFDTLVGENGAILSGGQRQRLAIARALLKDAPILILDEATSALDTESERRIQNALDLAKERRTTLVIAHRLSTIERADLIIVIDQGQIVERGSHAELLAANSYYARLHAKQFSEQTQSVA